MSRLKPRPPILAILALFKRALTDLCRVVVEGLGRAILRVTIQTKGRDLASLSVRFCSDCTCLPLEEL
jgi:hypothetical protein